MRLSTGFPLLLASSAFAFENTSPLLVSSSKLNKKLNYVEKAQELHSISELTRSICTSGDTLLYLEIDGLTKRDVDQKLLSKFNTKFSVAEHVVYESKDKTENFVSSDCSSLEIVADGSTGTNWWDKLTESDAQLNLVKIKKDDHLLEALEQISIIHKADHIIIQGLPSFSKPDSLLNRASHYFKQITHKRRSDVVDEEDYEQLEKELEEAFEEVEKLIGNETVAIYDDNSSSESGVALGSGNSTVVDGSLFDKYGFFTPGIFMSAIVSLFLFAVLSTALSWLNSLQVSYKAFEKPVTFGKKVQ